MAKKFPKLRKRKRTPRLPQTVTTTVKWGIFTTGGKLLEIFDYHQPKAARDRLHALNDSGRPCYLQKTKV